MNQTKLFATTVFFLLTTGMFSMADELVSINGREFRIPDGYRLEVAASQQLTKRPIVVDFDFDGNLYVAESSGTNDNVNKQLEDKPHSILRLSDTNADGIFDRTTVFADQMMFPEGVLWHDGSVYVSAPPQIWKFTDTDNDGGADERVVWFDGKTLTGCANDLHGPYLGPDGWIYWCKGAFAEQRHDRVGKSPLVTRAAHIFRRRPEGGPVEAVMTGGMDNPVEVVFLPNGERIFSTTFLQHPKNGKRDGLIHAIYGGLYGKTHSVLDGHPRTGELLAPLTHLGAAAPSGLVRLQSDTLGLQGHILTACFNLHSVTQHRLQPKGATYRSEDRELVSTDDIDFHPTDVIEDADGSLLIVDTGGWYKLCCPTSQLHKPEVYGSIYRLSKLDSPKPVDPRGLSIDWDGLTGDDLAGLLSDPRPTVRARAQSLLTRRGKVALPVLSSVIADSPVPETRNLALWTACRIGGQPAINVCEQGLTDKNATVRHSAAQAIGVWRAPNSLNALLALLKDPSNAVRRSAAEAIGRIGHVSAVPALLQAMNNENDRTLDHSLIYALIEIGDSEQTRLAFGHANPRVRRAAAIAVHGMEGGKIREQELVALLSDKNDKVQAAAIDLAQQRPESGPAFVQHFRKQIDNGTFNAERTAAQVAQLSHSRPMQRFIQESLTDDNLPVDFRVQLLQRLSENDLGTWNDAFAAILADDNETLISTAISKLFTASTIPGSLTIAISRVVDSEADTSTRLRALACLKRAKDEQVGFALDNLESSNEPELRGLAATAISRLKLTDSQQMKLAASIDKVGPLELGRTIDSFSTCSAPDLGRLLLTKLCENEAAEALPPQRVVQLAQQFGDDVALLAQPLIREQSEVIAKQKETLERLLNALPAGDIRRGQKVFHGKQTACFTCHAIGYRGGTVGPDLSRIGRVRSRRDLLESILFPSVSFVRSYEPVVIRTTDGKLRFGTIRDQSSTDIQLQLNANESERIQIRDIDERTLGTVSIMPAGLDKLISDQELADLLSFLESRK